MDISNLGWLNLITSGRGGKGWNIQTIQVFKNWLSWEWISLNKLLFIHAQGCHFVICLLASGSQRQVWAPLSAVIISSLSFLPTAIKIQVICYLQGFDFSISFATSALLSHFWHSYNFYLQLCFHYLPSWYFRCPISLSQFP